MDKLYTRVSPEFDPTSFTGVIVAGHELNDTYGFTELGYDEVDYNVAPTVLEVETHATKFASEADVITAAEAAGIKIWLTEDEYMQYWPGAVAGGFKEREFPDDNQFSNQLLAERSVQEILESWGFEAFHDYIVVSNTQPTVYIFWKPDTFSVVGPAAVVADDPNQPYDVRLADELSPSL